MKRSNPELMSDPSLNTVLQHTTNADQQAIYDHLLTLVKIETPDQMIQRFRTLFVEGVGYPEPAIAVAMDRLTAMGHSSSDFHFMLNRCFYILINHWRSHPQLQSFIPKLVAVFGQPAEEKTSLYQTRLAYRLHVLANQFMRTEQYQALRRLALMFRQSSVAVIRDDTKPLTTLAHRYPYIYEHYLLSDKMPQEHQTLVKQLQAGAQQKFEIDLSRYVLYQARHVHQRRLSANADPSSLTPVENPTLLSDRELWGALRHFNTKSSHSQTYRDLAHRFSASIPHTQTYQAFKLNLYNYLIASVDPVYGSRHFNAQLYRHLQNTLPQSNLQPLNDFLLIRTYSQLLNFLILENAHQPQQSLVVDLMNNLGSLVTTGIILKVALLCHQIIPYMGERFSILFRQHESQVRSSVRWLVNILENLNIALSLNFGSVDISFASALLV